MVRLGVVLKYRIKETKINTILKSLRHVMWPTSWFHVNKSTNDFKISPQSDVLWLTIGEWKPSLHRKAIKMNCLIVELHHHTSVTCVTSQSTRIHEDLYTICVKSMWQLNPTRKESTSKEERLKYGQSGGTWLSNVKNAQYTITGVVNDICGGCAIIIWASLNTVAHWTRHHLLEHKTLNFISQWEKELNSEC